ncbi:hypothetical protein AB5I41_09990 [Sphingomonas sp. MMS24-JH45]
MKRQARAIGAMMVGASAMALAMPVAAQTGDDRYDRGAGGMQGAPGSLVDKETDDGTIQDIVVTAQRREAYLQDVPVAVTAADAAVLAEARVENIHNVSAITPSVAIHQQCGVVQLDPDSRHRHVGNSRSFEGAVACSRRRLPHAFGAGAAELPRRRFAPDPARTAGHAVRQEHHRRCGARHLGRAVVRPGDRQCAGRLRQLRHADRQGRDLPPSAEVRGACRRALPPQRRLLPRSQRRP